MAWTAWGSEGLLERATSTAPWPSNPPQKQKVIISPVGACCSPKNARNLLEKWHLWCRVGPLELLFSESPEIPIKIVFWRGWELEAPSSLSVDECFVWSLVTSSPGHPQDPWKASNFPSGKRLFENKCPKPARKMHFSSHLSSFPGSTPSISPSKFGKNEWLTTQTGKNYWRRAEGVSIEGGRVPKPS